MKTGEFGPLTDEDNGSSSDDDTRPMRNVSINKPEALYEIDTASDDGQDRPVVKERAQWGSKLQFLLTAVAYAVGLGNVWRFPYLCQKNGGGAFLIPYIIMLIFEGVPLFVLELGIGQLKRTGSISVWNQVHSKLGGIGITSVVAAFLVALYYNVVISYCVFYLIVSFRTTLLWSDCPEKRYLPSELNETNPDVIALIEYDAECKRSPSYTSYFWYRTTLDISDGITDFGGINWHLFGVFILSWALVFAAVFRGIKSSGKVIYFTALFPYAVLAIFLVRGLTLPGSTAGILHLFQPKWEKLLEPKIWLDAATQIFYSLGLAFGSLISFGSFNDPKANVKRDAILVCTINALTSTFAALVIFSILGYKATDMYHHCIVDRLHKASLDNRTGLGFIKPWTFNADLDMFLTTYDHLKNNNYFYETVNVTKYSPSITECSVANELNKENQGAGLAFVVFTEAITKFAAAPFWSIIFFMMLLTLGMGSMIGTLEGVTTPIKDLQLFPWLKKWTITSICVGISFVIGLVFVTRAGQYWVQLFDDWAGAFSLTTVALAETIAIGWVYGARRFADDITKMCGVELGWYWIICWKYIGPGLIALCMVGTVVNIATAGLNYTAYDASTAMLSDTEPYPPFAKFVISVIIIAGVIPIPLVAGLRYFKVSKIELRLSDLNVVPNTTDSTAQFFQSNDDLADQMTSFKEKFTKVAIEEEPDEEDKPTQHTSKFWDGPK